VQTQADGEPILEIDTTYASPTGTNERVLNAVASRTVVGLSPTSGTFAREFWKYDNNPPTSTSDTVSAGFPTAHIIDRRDDTGASKGTIVQFTAIYDASGNPASVTTTREDGASRTVTTTYDSFGLAPVSVRTDTIGVQGAPAIPSMTTSILRDPVNLAALSTTDPNGTLTGATYDGFERVLITTAKPSGGVVGALSATSYPGLFMRARAR
jgi:hypothetical protein